MKFFECRLTLINEVRLFKYLSTKYLKRMFYLKFGDGDGPNLCRVKKVDVTFIENIFRSGLILVSSNDIITIKIDKKKM